MMKRMPKWIAFIVSLTILLSSPAVASANEGDDDLVTVAQAKEVIQEILDAIDVDASFEVRAAKIPNAAAAMAKGKLYILYNPVFITALYKATGSNRWAPISILAHEIGHHLKGHTLVRTGSQPSFELEADEFSGFVLRRMGASLEDAQLAMRIASNRRASTTHPARHNRLESIANGWLKAHIEIAGNNLSDLGLLIATNSSSYPYALQIGSTLLLVSNKGSLVTKDGFKLGYLTPIK
jgi:hypothetical protein